MKKIFFTVFTVLITLAVLIGVCQKTPAQFNIKIPKINKPKTEKPSAGENPPTPNEGRPTENRPAQKGEYLADPEATNVPKVLIETLEIKTHNEAKYVKAPTQNDYTSWLPQVSFDVMYVRGSPKLRYTADWSNPDGSLWFSEPLEMINASDDFPTLRSPYESVDINPKAIVAVGTYGLKITDTKTSQTVFQGKFKVSKMPLEASLKNKNLFYIENDWHLPVGYVGFKKNWTDYDVHTRPRVFMWFKGIPDGNQFEAELYYNNQRVATTDKGGGNINREAERGEDCYLKREVCAYSLWGFEWNNFVLDNSPNARLNNPNGYFTKDHPGEYTVKIFYNGDQVRETKFTVDGKGWIARNAFSDQVFLKDYRVVVPVKIVGSMEKWNPSAWKTDAFYGNPLNGFVAP